MDIVETFKVVGGIAGLAGLGLAFLLFIFRDVLAKSIFPQLTKEQAFKVIMNVMYLAFALAVVDTAAWMYTNFVMTDSVCTVKLTVVDAYKKLATNAVVDVDAGHAQKQADGTWIVCVRKSEKPKSGKIAVTILKDDRMAKEASVPLGEDGKVTSQTIVLDDTDAHTLKATVVEQLENERLGKPIDYADVTVDGFKTPLKTSQRGDFSCVVQDEDGKQVRVRIEKNGYEAFDDYLTVGGMSITIPLKLQTKSKK